ncbi:MAG: hypothetical protein HY470_01520 [Candidatus Ryanbacteria bacterium]|nr:hypothetical protein [Candidatus Ryanbacteria bacterium]
MPKWGVVFLVFIVVGLVATVVAFFVINVNPRKLAAKDTGAPEGPAGIMVSRDSGNTWEELDGSWGLTPLTFTFASGERDHLYVGTRGAGLWILKEGSKKMERVNDSSGVLKNTADVYSVAESPDGKALYLGVFQDNRGRVIRLTEKEAVQIYQTALEGYPVLEMFVDPLDELRIDIVAEGAFYEARDGGKANEWETLARIKDGFKKITRGRTLDDFFGVDGLEKIFVTHTGGRLWRETAPMTVDGHTAKTVYGMDYSSSRGSLLAATDFGLLETYNDGETWSALRTPVPPATLPITAVAAHPRFSEVIWMAAERLLYRSDDGGVAWSVVELPTTKKITLLKSRISNPKELYAGLSE